MNGISNAVAVQRLRQKITYLQGRLVDPNTPQKTLYWANLDVEALELAIAAINYLNDVQEYEKSQN
jgi:hypothetical protein